MEETNADWKTVAEKLKDIKVGMITTAAANGTLHSRPMLVQDLDENQTEMWFFTYEDSLKSEEVERNPHVNISFADEADDTYVSVSGFGHIVEDMDKMEEIFTPGLKAWFPDGLRTSGIALLHVNVTEAEYWDRTSNRMVQLFYKAKAIVTGEKPDDKEHGFARLDGPMTSRTGRSGE